LYIRQQAISPVTSRKNQAYSVVTGVMGNYVPGCYRQAKLFELNFFIRNYASQIALTGSQLAGTQPLKKPYEYANDNCI